MTKFAVLFQFRYFPPWIWPFSKTPLLLNILTYSTSLHPFSICQLSHNVWVFCSLYALNNATVFSLLCATMYRNQSLKMLIVMTNWNIFMFHWFPVFFFASFFPNFAINIQSIGFPFVLQFIILTFECFAIKMANWKYLFDTDLKTIQAGFVI